MQKRQKMQTTVIELPVTQDKGPEELCPEEPASPRPPATVLLKNIDQRYALHLLMYFAHWINQHGLPRISETHVQWIFFLLALVDDDIPADSMNMLRNLVRAHISLLKSLLEEETKRESGEEEEGSLTKTSCWIITTTIISVWRQRDLWNDAQDMLNSIN